MIIVRPNNSHRYQQKIEHLRAIEPPLWHIICADYFKAWKVVDLEVDSLTEDGLLIFGDKLFKLATGNNPTAQGQHTKLPMNPIDYKPRWDLIDLNKYRAHNWHTQGYENRSPYGVVYTSVSCPFNCRFCFSKDFYITGYQERPIKDVLDDFKYLGEQGVQHIKIIDELFVLKWDRVFAICEGIKKLGFNFNIWCYARIDTITPLALDVMKLAGINWVCYGIESGNEEIRRKENKGQFTNGLIKEAVEWTRNAGIKTLGNFMFGFEDDTKETMQETLDLAKYLNCEWVNFYCLVDKNVNQLAKDFVPRGTKTLSGIEVRDFRDKAFSEYFKMERLDRCVV